MGDKSVLPKQNLENSLEYYICRNGSNISKAENKEEVIMLQSPRCIEDPGSLLYESDSDDDLFLGIGGEVHQLMPSSYFTDEDLFRHPISPSGCPSMQSDAAHGEVAPLQGPGVLRGVCIPSERPKRKKRHDRNGTASHNKHAVGTSESCRVSEKPFSHRSRNLRHNTWLVKALTVDDLMDDDDYRR